MDLFFIITSILLGVGLAMDAFSVSIANGLLEPSMSRRRMCAIAGVYAAFQFAMPVIGWLCVRRVAEAFLAFQPFIPWIALILLLAIGGKMAMEGIRTKSTASSPNTPEESQYSIGFLTLLVQGIATSIDALSVGFTLAEYNAALACAGAGIIGLVTFLICLAGLAFGRMFGESLADRAQIFGGLILIAIGITIFVRG
ncbi:MAG: manganese efflux pump [Eubacterium sp.]|nr:manganese efflux pump [Eubacterium sp.]